MAVQGVVTELQRHLARRGQQVAAQREASAGNLVGLNRSEDRTQGQGYVSGSRCVCVCARAHQPVDVMNECVDDVSEYEGPGSSQAVLHLSEQQVDKQVIHEQDAMPLVAVGRLCGSFTHRQQDPLDRDLQHKKRTTYGTGAP